MQPCKGPLRHHANSPIIYHGMSTYRGRTSSVLLLAVLSVAPSGAVAQAFQNASLETWGNSTTCLINSVPNGWVSFSNEGIEVDECDFAVCGTTIPAQAAEGMVYGRAYAESMTTGEGIAQEVTGFVPGNEYQISFEFAGSNLLPGANPVRWKLFLDGLEVDQTIAFNSTETQWNTHTFSFFATNPAHLFGFRACNVNAPFGSAAIDNFQIQEVTIPDPDMPVAGFVGSDQIVCVGQCIVFTNTSQFASEVSWAFASGDPATSTNTDEVVVCYDQPGEYTVQLIATNASGTVDTAQAIVTVLAAVVDLGNDTSLCPGAELLLDAQNTGATFLWQDGSLLQTLLVTTAGTYSVTMDNGVCVAMDNITITYSTLAVDLGPDTNLCSLNDLVLDAGGQPTSYLWQDGSTAQTFTPQDTSTYWVEVSDGLCTVVDTLVISLEDIALDLGPDTLLCLGDSITLRALPGPEQYLWSTGATTSSLTIGAPDTYALTTFVGLCSATDTIQVDQVQVEAQFAYADTTGCAPPEVLFADLSSATDGPIVSWQWDFGDGDGSAQQAPTHVYDASGTYPASLIVTSANGCTDTIITTVNVVVFDAPEAAFTVDPLAPTAQEEVEFLDASTGADSWTWTFGDGASAQEQNPEHAYTQGGEFLVVLVVSNGPCSDTATALITVTDELVVHVPNAFTPDGNGINDVFRPVVNLPELVDFELLIFNRWGELIHTSVDPDQGWAGGYQGTNAPDGVYAWRMRLRDTANVERRVFEGHVTLLR